MIGVVHLLWAPLGPAPLREFVRSYRSHDAGAEHELIVLYNAPPRQRERAVRETPLAELGATRHRLIVLERPLLDLAAYGEAASRLDHERLCILNSYSVIQAEGWLGLLARALDQPGVGMVGASGSWESQSELRRGRAVFWPLQLMTLRSARRDYPRFPNPHLRTTGFMAARETVLDMGLGDASDKRSAYLLESGRDSITRKIHGRGKRTVVVGRDGVPYDVDEWPRSRTYRSGGQANLLVADNRTRDWERAGPRLRSRLARDAWGEAL